VKPELQSMPQVPPSHFFVPLGASGHTMLQPPQCDVLLFWFTQLLLQFWKPVLHLMPHVLLVHAATPFTGGGHALPQLLQFAGSVFVSTHEPSQSVVPLGQPARHCPPAHTMSAQEFPHTPQLFGSCIVSVHTMLPGLISHFTKPGLQENWQTPATHAAVALGGTSHDVVQFPQ
jgi:hypothetical protein